MSGGTDAGDEAFWAEDPDGAAGEYVLGTLAAQERAAFVRALEQDASLRAAVTAWEMRLAPLAETVPAVAPDPRVWATIEARIGAGSITAAASRRAEADGAQVLRLERGLRRWRAATGVAAALAAGLALWIVAGPRSGVDGGHYLAVVDRGGVLPALIVRVDLDGGTVQVRSLAAEAPPDRSLELWYIGAGAPPRSLGLVTNAARLTLPAALREPAEGASLAVSVEPKGGSPTGAPTGPVIYSGRLMRE